MLLKSKDLGKEDNFHCNSKQLFQSYEQRMLRIRFDNRQSNLTRTRLDFTVRSIRHSKRFPALCYRT